MEFSLTKVIYKIARQLNISKKIVEEFIDGHLGTRWILERELNCSEVELGMFLKTLRKRLSYNFRYNFNLNLSLDEKIYLFSQLKNQYKKFFQLHNDFLKNKNCSFEIKKILLKNILIIDSGISNERFFQLLQTVLKKISPIELALFFDINTLLRWEIALYLQSKIKNDLFVRGSLIFFNARSFGCGYLANFPQEKKIYKNLSTYSPLQGSDLDLRVKADLVTSIVNKQIAQYIKNITSQLSKYNTKLTIEITNLNKNSFDDIILVRDFPKLLKIAPIISFNPVNKKPRLENISIKERKIIPFRIKKLICYQFHKINKKTPDKFPRMDLSTLHSVQNELFSFFLKLDIPVGEIKEIIFLVLKELRLLDVEKKIRLSFESLKNLNLALEKILVYYKVNGDLINKYLIKWRQLLEKSRRETDFYGYVTQDYLFAVFENLFFLSGNRFSKSELKNLFKELLSEYEKTKI